MATTFEFIRQQQLMLSAGVLVALLIWESVAPFFDFFRGRLKARVQHAARNISLGLLNGVLTALLFVSLWTVAASWAEGRAFGVAHWLRLPPWGQALAAVLLLDLWTYWWHRWNHLVPFLWRFHRVHHSDPNMDVTTANRFHVGEIFISASARCALIPLFGIQLWQVALYEAILFPIVQFHHANIAIPEKLDQLLRLVFVTPAMHKVHHSRWQPETDSNYTSMLSVWDRLFGSFRLQPKLEAIRLGLDGYDDEGHQTLPGLLKTPVE